MIAVISIVYGFCVWILFAKLKWAKPRPVPIAVAAVVGVVLIGGMVIVWRFSAPFSTQLVVARYVVQLVPQSKGQIQEIHAKALVPLKKNEDILFEINPEPYEHTVNQITAELAAANHNIQQNEAIIQAATANIAKFDADLLAAKGALDVGKETERLDSNAISELRIVELTQKHEAAQAIVDQANANAEQAQFGLMSAQDTARSIQARLSDAKFDLEQCTVRAPSDGFVVNWVARKGTMTASLPFAAVGTFVDTSEVRLVAVFSENVLRFVQSGDKVEIAIKSRPGEIFAGSVVAIVNATGEGQFVTGGTVPVVADIESDGMLAVKLTLDDPEVRTELPLGAAGAVSIYTKKGKPFHMISKIGIRMQAWKYYLLPM